MLPYLSIGSRKTTLALATLSKVLVYCLLFCLPNFNTRHIYNLSLVYPWLGSSVTVCASADAGSEDEAASSPQTGAKRSFSSAFADILAHPGSSHGVEAPILLVACPADSGRCWQKP